MAWFIDDLNQYQIHITDLWAEYYIPKFQLDEHGSLVVEEPYLHIYWNDRHKGDGLQQRHLQIDYRDVVDGYSGYVDNPQSAASLQSSIESMIVSGWVDASVGDLLTEKGDLLTNDGVSDTVLKVTANRKYLRTDTGEATYLKWAYIEMGTSSQSGDFTLALTDSFTTIECSTAAELKITIPTNTNVAFPVGTIIKFVTLSTGVVYFEADTGVTTHSLNEYLGILPNHGAVYATKTGTNTWYLDGDLTRKFDADALAFITAVGTLDDTQQVAVDDLVISLKADSLWTKCEAIYPFVGGTAAAHKWNAKDPQDTDAAHRLVFTGSPTHSANGVTFNGSTQYANTYLNPTTDLTQDSTHIFVSRRNNTNAGVEVGIEGTGSSRFLITARNGGSFHNIMYEYPANSILVAQASSVGKWTITRTSSTVLKSFLDSVQQGATDTDASAGWSGNNYNMFIGASNTTGTAANYCNCELDFVTIGAGLSDADVTNLTNHVTTFNTAISR